MSGLCGWLNARIADEHAMATVSSMAASLGGSMSVPPALGRDYGLAAAGQHASQHYDGSLIAVVSGRSRWHSDEFRHIAEQASPAAALVAAYRKLGVDCLREIHGAFSLAVIDSEKHTALLAVDRMGTQRLCFAPYRNAFQIPGRLQWARNIGVAHPCDPLPRGRCEFRCR